MSQEASHADEKTGKHGQKKDGGLWELAMSTTTFADVALLVFGTVAAIISGALNPIMTVRLKLMTKSSTDFEMTGCLRQPCGHVSRLHPGHLVSGHSERQGERAGAVLRLPRHCAVRLQLHRHRHFPLRRRAHRAAATGAISARCSASGNGLLRRSGCRGADYPHHFRRHPCPGGSVGQGLAVPFRRLHVRHRHHRQLRTQLEARSDHVLSRCSHRGHHECGFRHGHQVRSGADRSVWRSSQPRTGGSELSQAGQSAGHSTKAFFALREPSRSRPVLGTAGSDRRCAHDRCHDGRYPSQLRLGSLARGSADSQERGQSLPDSHYPTRCRHGRLRAW
ncbi:hypothetical protein MPH_09088 [Macrophomina phaseolina MS6]|uniref:Uncharacterized protein n=1 Tax=Macrophomina phaseolina (strain MS6) TaxID=1126212 RepID=K2RUA3_MACPH|nr:hypothetical protein MPH_09088 [Macrophomina phaseolina MS6]